MKDSIPTQLRFPAIAGFSVRADFNGGTLSSDFGALLLQGVDRQTGLIEHWPQSSRISGTRPMSSKALQ